MDSNKIVDNLNFIKIYFRVFIYKIIALKYPELSKKEMKNHKRRMKTHLRTRTSHKTLEEESKQPPNTKVHSEPLGKFDTFGVSNDKNEKKKKKKNWMRNRERNWRDRHNNFFKKSDLIPICFKNLKSDRLRGIEKK